MIKAMENPAAKAWMATAAFALFGIASALFFSLVTEFLLPHSIFYALLVLNTFFSVRFFSGILVPSSRQFVVDAALVILYAALAYSLGNPAGFPLAATALFGFASLKYIIELGSNPYTAVLKRKITIDLLGAAFCAAIFVGALFGYPLESAWAFATIFALANVYLLLIRPMYRL